MTKGTIEFKRASPGYKIVERAGGPAAMSRLLQRLYYRELLQLVSIDPQKIVWWIHEDCLVRFVGWALRNGFKVQRMADRDPI